VLINLRAKDEEAEEKMMMSYTAKFNSFLYRFILINEWGRHAHTISRTIN
jgi:hypothetical protein